MKKLIKKWLGITALENENKELKLQIEELQRPDELLRKFHLGISQIENLKKYFTIGLDVSPRGEESWAVICAKGTKEYVTFADLSNRDMVDIARFLKQFQLDERNVFVDSPFNKRIFWK